jgi:hypothetical protein
MSFPGTRSTLSTAARHLALVAVSAMLAACATWPSLKTTQAKPERAEPSMKPEQNNRPSALCSDKQGNPFALRKKVLVLALPVQNLSEATDLPDLAMAWSVALQQRLQSSERYLIRDGSRFVLDPAGDLRAQITNLARSFDAQIVISGQITSTKAQSGKLRVGSVGSIPLPFGDKRVIETVLEIYEGPTSVRLARIDNHVEASGEVINQGGAPFTGNFYGTALGKATAELLDQQAESIKDELACLPLQANIVRTQDGEARLDAGFSSHIKTGDIFRVFQHQGVPAEDGSQVEKAFGSLVINQVFPESAIGHFEGSEQPDWRYSVIVRPW